jgi:serine/threonine protein kinase/Tfp pilus assembly protein PilF
MSLSPGERLGHYVVISPLGAGGMGEVYRARDEELGRDIALKILPEHLREDRAALTRFAREAKTLAALSHPHIVAIHQFDTTGVTPYLVMELLDGQTLQDRIARSPLPWRKAVEIGRQIADALAAAHSRGIVHRDLKPSNIFLSGPTEQVKLLDFGLARSAPERESDENSSTDIRTRSGTVLGTPSYMSPEQAAGEVAGERTDIFSLGCILYEMLSGKSPFLRPTASQSITAVLRDEPDLSRIDAPPEVLRILERCLKKDPAERLQSARDIALGFQEALSEPARPPRPRRKMLWVAGAAAAALIVTATVLNLPRQPASKVSSLAVLPFENSSRDPETEFFCDGITEDLINSLSRLPDVRVVARTTAFTYKGKPHDLERLRRDLKVDAILTGRVMSRGQELSIQADLIDLDTKAQIWGDRYQQSSADPMAIQQSIVGQVIEHLRIPVTSEQHTRLTARQSESREAYELYLRGRHEWNKRSPEGILKARDYMQRAIDRDPAFAGAWSALADTYILMGGRFRMMPAEESYSRAEYAARRALEIDPRMAEAHASLGQIHSNQFRWKSAEKEFRQSIALNPNYAQGRTWYALVLGVTGQPERALDQLRKAGTLDPLSPHVAANTGRCLIELRDFEGGIAQGKKALEMNPDFSDGYLVLGRGYEYQGDYQRAAEAYQRMAEVPGPPLAGRAALARAWVKLGRTAEAQAALRELEERWPTGQIAPTPLAWVYAALGEKDRAFFWLEKGLETRDVNLRDSLRLFEFSELRDDPRYADLVHRVVTVEK